MAKNLNDPRKRRQRRIRLKISGTPERPRLNVFRSLHHIYAQVIDDVAGHTLASASTMDKDIAEQVAGKKKSEQAAIVGKVVAQRALDAGIQEVVFDRGGYVYHGRVKALADGAREGGLKL
ncbi:MAG: 50S ribosomal protein L18 [Anaerolineae bacterium]|nr:50S ribosomal protein L18 [Promineifilum sp.]MCZ2113788.1 50S ribosomal protein L18 [Anaerolineae bacterium]